jgi:uncharacterized protein YbcI
LKLSLYIFASIQLNVNDDLIVFKFRVNIEKNYKKFI